MQHPLTRSRLLSAAALAVVLCAPAMALAQSGPGLDSGSGGGGIGAGGGGVGGPQGGGGDSGQSDQGSGDDSDKKAAASPPPSLPGSHAAPTEVAPADKSVVDLNPTSALFDSINRGDITAARDAISRGADLNGKNVLGLTPVELSVDLGRNEISFLLLSMRGDGPDAPPPPVATTKHGHVVPVSARGKQAAPAPVAAAPDAGFLGFGGGS